MGLDWAFNAPHMAASWGKARVEACYGNVSSTCVGKRRLDEPPGPRYPPVPPGPRKPYEKLYIYTQKLILVNKLFFFENFKPYVLTLLDRYKDPFYHQQLEETWGYIVSKYGLKRRQPFRVKLKKLNKFTTIEFTSIKV